MSEGLTVAAWLQTPYPWIFLAICVAALVGNHFYEKRQAEKSAGKLRHPSAKFKRHDEWYQKKYGVPSR